MNQQAHIPHDPESAEYWLQQARNSRALAAAASRRRDGSIESIMIHDREAEAYERRAAAIKCRSEWDNVNDPPCHPSDPGWSPCAVCK